MLNSELDLDQFLLLFIAQVARPRRQVGHESFTVGEHHMALDGGPIKLAHVEEPLEDLS